MMMLTVEKILQNNSSKCRMINSSNGSGSGSCNFVSANQMKQRQQQCDGNRFSMAMIKMTIIMLMILHFFTITADASPTAFNTTEVKNILAQTQTDIPDAELNKFEAKTQTNTSILNEENDQTVEVDKVFDNKEGNGEIEQQAQNASQIGEEFSEVLRKAQQFEPLPTSLSLRQEVNNEVPIDAGVSNVDIVAPDINIESPTLTEDLEETIRKSVKSEIEMELDRDVSAVHLRNIKAISEPEEEETKSIGELLKTDISEKSNSEKYVKPDEESQRESRKLSDDSHKDNLSVDHGEQSPKDVQSVEKNVNNENPENILTDKHPFIISSSEVDVNINDTSENTVGNTETILNEETTDISTDSQKNNDSDETIEDNIFNSKTVEDVILEAVNEIPKANVADNSIDTTDDLSEKKLSVPNGENSIQKSKQEIADQHTPQFQNKDEVELENKGKLLDDSVSSESSSLADTKSESSIYPDEVKPTKLTEDTKIEEEIHPVQQSSIDSKSEYANEGEIPTVQDKDKVFSVVLDENTNSDERSSGSVEDKALEVEKIENNWKSNESNKNVKSLEVADDTKSEEKHSIIKKPGVDDSKDEEGTTVKADVEIHLVIKKQGVNPTDVFIGDVENEQDEDVYTDDDDLDSELPASVQTTENIIKIIAKKSSEVKEPAVKSEIANNKNEEFEHEIVETTDVIAANGHEVKLQTVESIIESNEKKEHNQSEPDIVPHTTDTLIKNIRQTTEILNDVEKGTTEKSIETTEIAHTQIEQTSKTSDESVATFFEPLLPRDAGQTLNDRLLTAESLGGIGKALPTRSINEGFTQRSTAIIILCSGVAILFIVISVTIFLVSFQRQHGTLDIEMQERRCGKDNLNDNDTETCMKLLDVELPAITILPVNEANVEQTSTPLTVNCNEIDECL